MKNPSYTDKDLDVRHIVLKHEGLVRRIAFRMHSKVASFVELDDLLQSGLEGLVDAAQKYTSVEGASFENYLMYGPCSLLVVHRRLYALNEAWGRHLKIITN